MRNEKKTGLSIKYKLLALLVLLPVLTLLLYLGLAIRLFESDKIAYVFDSSAAVSRTLASQTLAEIHSFMSGLSSVLAGYRDSEGRFDGASVLLFRKDPAIQAIRVLKKGPAGAFPELKRNGAIIPGLTADVLGKTACSRGFAFEPGQTQKELMDGLFYIALCENRVPIIAIGQSQALLKAFGKNGVYSDYLLDSSGRRLLGPARGALESFASWDFLSSLLKTKQVEKTSEEKSPDGKRFIVSAARVGAGDLLVLSLVERTTALKAVDILLWKSLLFLICLISLAILISVYASNRLTSTLRDLEQATGKVAEGQFDIRVNVRSNDEVGSLASHFNQMAGEVSRLMADNISKARMEKELETARTVQETLFPPPQACLGPLRIAGFYEPASECGGDWWHHGVIGDKVFLWIGDVTGHGAPAALITSAAKSAATLIEELPAVTPASALELLNKSVYRTSNGKLHMTFFLASFDQKTGELVYCNASHNPPFLIRNQDGQRSRKDFHPLDDVNNPRLGESLDTQFKEAKLSLALGDHVLFYTDGVVELVGRAGEPWGERNFIKSVISGLSASAQPGECIASIRRSTQDFRAGAALADDVTFFLCAYEGETGGRTS